MKNFMKKSLSVLLALMMLSGSFMCFAVAELNQDAVDAHYDQYKNYVLLGDSVASGYRDEMSDNDAHNNDLYMDSTYCRYVGSYSDVLANAIIADKSMTALAGPGFRTIEMRYMLEDDYAKNCEDEYLFWPSHLYVYEDQVCDCHGVNMTPGSEHFRDMFKTSIANADLITLGIGGNDWGAYLGWVLNQILEKENPGGKYAAEAAEILKQHEVIDLETIAKLLELAQLAGALPELVQSLPETLNYGLSNFYKNWDFMIQDIYDLNPDVTLMVVGMSDNSLKGKNYDYEGVPGTPVVGDEIPEEIKPALKMVVDFIMTVGNTPMIEGAKKFGYTYVDTDGATYVESHPDADGHVFIANKIIEALPNREISTKYSDVTPGHKYYTSIEYVIANGIMEGTSETTFAPDAYLTDGQLAAAINVLKGSDNKTDSTEDATAIQLATSLVSVGAKKGIVGFFKSFTVLFKIISAYNFNVAAKVTRAEAAYYIKSVAEL